MPELNCDCDAPWARETMEAMRVRLMRRLGFSAQVTSPPPGMSELLRDFLSEAQRLVYQEYAVLRQARIFRWLMVAGERFYDFIDYDGALIPAPTTDDVAVTRTHGGGVFLDQRADFQFTWVNAIGETVASETIIVPTELTGDTDCKYRVDWTTPVIEGCTSPIVSLRIYAKFQGDSAFTLRYTRPVADGTYTVNAVVISSTQPLTTNTARQALSGRWVFDPDKIEWVCVGRPSGGRFYHLGRGIDAGLLSDPIESGDPTRWDVRNCIELWPAPVTADYLYVRAQVGLFPFAADGDYTTVDPDVIFLRALANAKAHYGKSDASNYQQQEVIRIGRYVASTHRGKRCIPTSGWRSWGPGSGVFMPGGVRITEDDTSRVIE